MGIVSWEVSRWGVCFYRVVGVDIILYMFDGFGFFRRWLVKK